MHSKVSPAPATTYNWLTNTNTNNEFNENLVAYLEVTVTNKSSQKDAKLNLQFEASDLSKFNGAIDVSGTNKYISAPTFTQVNASDAQKVTDSTVHSYSNAESAENKFAIGTTKKKAGVEAEENITAFQEFLYAIPANLSTAFGGTTRLDSGKIIG